MIYPLKQDEETIQFLKEIFSRYVEAIDMTNVEDVKEFIPLLASFVRKAPYNDEVLLFMADTYLTKIGLVEEGVFYLKHALKLVTRYGYYGLSGIYYRLAVAYLTDEVLKDEELSDACYSMSAAFCVTIEN